MIEIEKKRRDLYFTGVMKDPNKGRERQLI